MIRTTSGKPAWFPVFPADILADPEHRGLSTEEWGALFLLLCHQWTEGFIPDDLDRQARYCGCMRSVCERIAFLFTRNAEGMLVKRWLDEKRKELVGKSDDARKAAESRWNRHKGLMRTHSGRNADAMQNENKNENEIKKKNEIKNTPPTPRKRGALTEGIDEHFLAFWQAYPKKVGKKEALKAWVRAGINNGMVEQVIEAVKTQSQWPKWLEEGGRFIPNPATWLNQGRWDDEHQAFQCPRNERAAHAMVGRQHEQGPAPQDSLAEARHNALVTRGLSLSQLYAIKDATTLEEISEVLQGSQAHG